MNLPCPACGFLTVDEEFYGTYNICDICGWEDDGVQLANPACGVGANKESLIEAQAMVLPKHPLIESVTAGFKRDLHWRPLRPDEIVLAEQEYKEKVWKNQAVSKWEDTYWSKAS